MKTYNIVVVGGGSIRTPDLIAMLANKKNEFPIRKLVLYDNDPENNALVGEYSKILIREYYPEMEEYSYTCDPDEAFTGMDFALMQIREGLMEMRRQDEHIPAAHGCIGQETCGAGGFAYGLRSVPAIIDIVKMIRERSPECWILNYSNPAAIVAEATKRVFPDDYRIMNICDMPIAIMDRYGELLGRSRYEFEPRYFGLNHFGWFTHVYDKVTGEDLAPIIKEKLLTTKFGQGNEEHTMEKSWLETYNFMGKMLEDYPEYLPNTYLKYYLYPNHVLETQDPNHTRADEIYEFKRPRVLNMLKEVIELGAIKGTKYDLGDNRSTHAAYIVDLALSIAENKNDIFLIITKNNGAVPNLDPEMMLEVACRVGIHGPEPLSMEPITTFYKGMIENQYAYEHLTVDGLMERNKTKLLQALALNRCVNDTDTAKAILEDLIEANKPWWGKYFTD